MNNNVNTFIIGAQKAGTTSLYDWLGQHPDVYAPQEIKDYHFFSNDSIFEKGISHFEKFYLKNTEEVKIHGGVNYLYNHNVAAKRIYEYNPDAKIIICLRNPVKRAVSAYKYFVRILKESNTFEKAIELEKNNKITGIDKNHFTYIEHGKYLNQIIEFHRYFNSDKVKILLFEELTDSSKSQLLMNDLSKFLEIENYNYSFTHMNKSATPKLKWINNIIRGESKIKKIKELIPLQLKRKVLKVIEEKNISDEALKIEISEEMIEMLENEYHMEIQNLSEYLKMDLTKVWGFND